MITGEEWAALSLTHFSGTTAGCRGWKSRLE